MVGGRSDAFRGCGIGCRGLVVEVDRYAIARLLLQLGYSMGPILDAKGGQRHLFHDGYLSFFFPHSEASLEVFYLEGCPEWVEMARSSYDDDQYRVKHRTKNFLALTIKIFKMSTDELLASLPFVTDWGGIFYPWG